MTSEALFTLDQYFDVPDEPFAWHELLDGRLVELPKLYPIEQALLLPRLVRSLVNLCDRSFPGLLVTGRTGFILAQQTVQGPDMALVRRSVLEAAEVYRGALKCAPDLAVEIVFPTEASADLDDKVANYLAAGTSTVWVLWPRRRHALVYHRNGSVQHVTSGQLLEAPEILPGAGIPLDDVFAGAPGV
jgi:Uma2 family endonuclease